VITKPTVLVLGAGASIPYGYPSGAGLLREIAQQSATGTWLAIFNAYGISNSEVNAFRMELHLSQKPSIDAFLEHRPEYMKVGKAAIALSLLSKENPDALLDFDVRDKGIYHFLYNNLATSWEDFKQNKLSIITFNYDRSLEHFLFSALKHSYNRSDTEIREAIESIPIIHVHGSLGPLPWQESDGIKYYPLFDKQFAPYELGRRVKIASENLVIVSEAQPKSRGFEVAYARLLESESIYFLGFGYYSVNMERLGLLNLHFLDETLAGLAEQGVRMGNNIATNENVKYHIRHFRGSAFGLGTAQIRSIQNKWGIGLIDNKCSALEFLKEYADLS
jgi:hypothetical protein